MPEVTFTIIFFYSFPEAMVLALLSLSLLGIRPDFRQTLLIVGRGDRFLVPLIPCNCTFLYPCIQLIAYYNVFFAFLVSLP